MIVHQVVSKHILIPFDRTFSQRILNEHPMQSWLISIFDFCDSINDDRELFKLLRYAQNY